jgi:hypothetical protein
MARGDETLALPPAANPELGIDSVIIKRLIAAMLTPGLASIVPALLPESTTGTGEQAACREHFGREAKVAAKKRGSSASRN